jgi:two-component system, OmpR family, alkaline phosphatase synthesis response regulator PhoP
VERKAKILLIDDDADFVESTKMILESKPYEIIVAVNGADGLRKAREEKPDLIILDIIMPVENGFTAAEQLKKDPKLAEIPVLMLTSYSTKGVGTGIPYRRGLEVEYEDYIDKPVRPDDLLTTVAKHLQKM